MPLKDIRENEPLAVRLGAVGARDSRRIAWYGLTIFLSSAFLLVLEIAAGRLIAPYVGVSLYTWTSIIGVILAGLSLGNWLGGVWADRGGNEASAGITLALGALASLAILLLLMLVAPLIQASSLNLLSSSFLYVITLFFVPAMLLGVITPLLTTLALRLDTRSGHVVGRMHALAALGSILGTFVTGYWLVQTFGTKNIIVGTAIGLFLLAIPYLRGTWRTVAAVALAAVALGAMTYARQGFTNPCDRESNYYCIRVVDQSVFAPFGRARAMILDHLNHGTSHESEPGLLLFPPLHLMDELIRSYFDAEDRQRLRYFFAGGGAYTLPRSVKAGAPGTEVTVAELDPSVTDVAVESLYLDPDGMRIVHADARVVLQQSHEQRYDVVVLDAFHDLSLPYHLATREYVELVKMRLKPAGLYLLNVVDVFPDARLVKSMMKTLGTEFRYVDAWIETLPSQPVRMTFVISATDLKPWPDAVRAQNGLNRVWYRITDPLLTSGVPPDRLPMLTDDFVPLEQLTSRLFFTEHGR